MHRRRIRLWGSLAVAFLAAVSLCTGCGHRPKTGKVRSQERLSRLPATHCSALCGPVALAAACRQMGMTISVEELAELAGTDEAGTSMYGLAKAAEALGLEPIGLELSYQELTELPTPVIVHMGPKGAGHFEALGAAKENRVLILDLNSQRRQPADEFKSRWSGYVLQLKKESAE